VDLAAQALVFTLVVVSWVMGAKYSSPYDGYEGFMWGLFVVWHQYVGWVAVDVAVFVGVQASLLWTATCSKMREEGCDDEMESLLHA
jgi:hypothetical protein